MKLEELKEIVDRLNENVVNEDGHFSEAPGNQYFHLIYVSGYVGISYGDLFLWDDQEDERESNDETGEYEDLYTFIWKKFTKFVNDLNNVVAKSNFKQQ